MKKLLVFSLLLIIGLSGCSVDTPPDLKMDFTAEVSALGDDFYLIAELTSIPQGIIYLRVTTPDEIKGLSYRFADELEISFSGLTAKVKKDYLPEETFAFIIYEVLFDLPRDAEFQGFVGDEALFTGKTSAGAYEAFADKKGNIKNISLKEINMKVELRYR